MKGKILLSLLITLTIASIQFGQVITSGDTLFISGGTMSGGQNAGLLEGTINADTTAGGARVNVNRVYALYYGEVYYQETNINVTNPTGVLNIVGVNKIDPNYKANTGSSANNGATLPIILIQPSGGVDVPANVLYGSLNIQNVHWQVMEMDGTLQNELFYLGTQNKLAQSLTINNSLFEFSSIDLFDATNESGAIGGWPNGAKFKITNSYFRNLFYAGQWWGSRVFQCKHPIDTLWVENCTITTGGLTFLQQNEATKFAYFNHNTIINNKKYWVLSPFWMNLIVTNNIFTNQDWVGEDTNVTNSGQDPDKAFMSTIDIDTITARLAVTVEQQYYASADSSSYTSACNLNNIVIFVSDNINFDDPALTTGYYTNSTYTLNTAYSNGYTATAIPSYLNWGPGAGPWIVGNMPGEWMNARTTMIVANNSPAKGGQMVVQNTTTSNTALTGAMFTLSPTEVTDMAVWNQNQYGDSRFPTGGTITSDGTVSGFIYGDYTATTVPGLVNGKPSDAVTGEAAGTQVGITKFTDLGENFYQTAVTSAIDQLPVGSLIWNDAALAAFSSKSDLAKVYAAAKAAGITSLVLTAVSSKGSNLPNSYSLSQNYPNPFNPSTVINYSIQKASNVTLTVYNVLGQKVASLVNGFKQAGSYSVSFDATKLASGVYFYRIEAGNFVSVKKMMFMK
ncbi:MAG: T9SS type A sorting domain-containing protein [Ignavibacteriaceae bacterium]